MHHFRYKRCIVSTNMLLHKERGMMRVSVSFLFLLLGVGGLEGEAVVNDSLNGCQSRGTALPAGKGVLPCQSPSRKTWTSFLLAGAVELSPSVLRRLENIVENCRSRGLSLRFLLIFFGRSSKTVINCFLLAYLPPLPKKEE